MDTYTTHVFSYRFEGREFTVDIIAKNEAEAKSRLKALAFARYDGRVVARMPIEVGPFVRIAVFLRNSYDAIFR